MAENSGFTERTTTVEPGQRDRQNVAEPTAGPARGRRRSRRWPANAGAERRTTVITDQIIKPTYIILFPRI